MLHWLLHIGSIANFAYALYYDLYVIDWPGRRSFGGQWKFLTFWNMWIQLVYFSLSLLNNLFGSHSSDKASASNLQKARDFFFATLAFPIGQFVGIVFWSLFMLDRELVFPVRYDAYFPTYINHMMHTTVIPAQFLELVMLYHIYPSKKTGMLIFCNIINKIREIVEWQQKLNVKFCHFTLFTEIYWVLQFKKN
jgi:hypothetical protein